MRWRAKHPPGTREYYDEPYTAQHFLDFLKQLGGDLWHAFRYLASPGYRLEMHRAYNRAIFGNIPTNQIYVQDGDGMRPLREDERNWPE